MFTQVKTVYHGLQKLIGYATVGIHRITRVFDKKVKCVIYYICKEVLIMRALLEDRRTFTRQVVEFNSCADDIDTEIRRVLTGNEDIEVEQVQEGLFAYSIADGIGKLYIASNHPVTEVSNQVLIVEPIDFYMYSLVQRPY